MAVTADAVKQLRERTGAGMMECKKALVETHGDLDSAAELMRKQGLAKADKKATRVAAEGVLAVCTSSDGRSASMIEVNCETDFVAREADFRGFADEVARLSLAAQPADLAALHALRISGDQSGKDESVEERRRALIAKIGENISVRRFVRLTAPTHLGAYLHGTRIAALVALQGGDASTAHDLAMHIAASSPRYISSAEVPAELVAKEREILTAQALAEGKSADIIARMVEGRLRKQVNELVLLGQAFVKDPDQSIEKLLRAANAVVTRFERFELGAGIERKHDDFVGEVMAQVKASSSKDAPNGKGPASKS